MSAYLVYVFLMIRGELGSVTKRKDVTFIRESISLYSFLQDRISQMPGTTTILENINAVSNETRELIFARQIREDVAEAYQVITYAGERIFE